MLSVQPNHSLRFHPSNFQMAFTGQVLRHRVSTGWRERKNLHSMCQFPQVLCVNFKFIFDNNSNYIPFKQITHSIKTIESFHWIEPCTELACIQPTDKRRRRRERWKWMGKQEHNMKQRASELEWERSRVEKRADLNWMQRSGETDSSSVDNSEIGINNKREILQHCGFEWCLALASHLCLMAMRSISWSHKHRHVRRKNLI